jgi:hypothetical protein
VFGGIPKKKRNTWLAYDLEHIMSYTVQLHPPEIVGPTSEGLRVNLYVSSGDVNGPKVHGKLRPVGGDWLTVRTDGVGIMDVRANIETPEEALIYVTYTGVAELGAEGYERFLRGDLPPTVPLRVVPRVQTAHRDFLRLNRLQCLGIGEVDTENLVVSYDVCSVR